MNNSTPFEVYVKVDENNAQKFTSRRKKGKIRIHVYERFDDEMLEFIDISVVGREDGRIRTEVELRDESGHIYPIYSATLPINER